MSLEGPEDLAQAWTGLGRQLAERRRAAGHTQESLAPLTYYTRSTVANVESGRQRIGRDFWSRCDQVLDAGGALTAEYARIWREANIRRIREVSVASADTLIGRVTPSDVLATPAELLAQDGRDSGISEWGSFSRLTNHLAQQRQAVSPEVLLCLVEAHRECIATLFRRAGSDPLRATIGAMLAQASIVSSRLWSAQGNRALAVAHCAYARQLADSIGDHGVGATARIFESNLHSDAATLTEADGDVMTGLRLLEEAAVASEYVSAAARARIAAEQAQIYAALQLQTEAQLALGRARDAVAAMAPEDCSGLFSDWTPTRLLVHEGTCNVLLGSHREAASALELASRRLASDPANVNVLLAANVDLATAYAGIGHLDQACDLLGETYGRLKAAGNLRGIARARRARSRLSRWKREPAVLELDARIADG